MPAVDRNPNGGSCDSDRIVVQNLLRFMDQFHFLPGVVIFQENVAMGKTIVKNRMRIRWVFRCLAFFFSFVLQNSFGTGSGDGLVSRDDQSLDLISFVQL